MHIGWGGGSLGVMEECNGGQGDVEKDGQESTTRKNVLNAMMTSNTVYAELKTPKQTNHSKQTNKPNKRMNQKTTSPSHPLNSRKKKKKAIKPKPYISSLVKCVVKDQRSNLYQ